MVRLQPHDHPAAALIVISSTAGMLVAEDPPMEPIDLEIWLLAGLIAGGLAGALWPGTSRAVRWVALAAGALGALVGGRLMAGLLGASSFSFLGAVCFGVVCALLPVARAQRSGPSSEQ